MKVTREWLRQCWSSSYNFANPTPVVNTRMLLIMEGLWPIGTGVRIAALGRPRARVRRRVIRRYRY